MKVKPLSTRGRSRRRLLGSGIGLGLVGALFVERPCVAQTPPWGEVSGRLTVRPREMATGTRTDQAGKHLLDSLPEESFVYVPEQCVGTRRCPLFVFLWGGGPEVVMRWQRPVADKYGMILLAPTPAPTDWYTDDNRTVLDAALKQTLRKFAIDPDKIAIIGRCASGTGAKFFGASNLDVFSRVVLSSGAAPLFPAGMDHRNTTTEFFVIAGHDESSPDFVVVEDLRKMGHPVRHLVGFRGHEHQVEDYDFMGRWLQASWAASDSSSARLVPQVIADPMPLLTSEVLTQMTQFWASFMREPDSIQNVARRAHLREVVLPVGQTRPSVVMVDMPALAARYPSVAAALAAVGLTPEQHDAYRVALMSARTTKYLTIDMPANRDLVGTFKAMGWRQPQILVEPASVLEKNVAFFSAHLDALAELEATGMWSTP